MNGPYVPPQNCEVTPRDGGDSMARVEDMLHKRGSMLVKSTLKT